MSLLIHNLRQDTMAKYQCGILIVIQDSTRKPHHFSRVRDSFVVAIDELSLSLHLTYFLPL